MISKLTLEGYRSFESYSLADLRRVNLLVGPNNSGKTSILDAVSILASQGNPSVLVAVAERRSESSLENDDSTGNHRRRRVYDLSHQFHGHRFNLDTHFTITSDCSLGSVRVAVSEAPEDVQAEIFTIEPDAGAQHLSGFHLNIERKSQEDVSVPVSDGGSLLWPSRTVLRASSKFPKARPDHFLTTESLTAAAMAPMWDQVLLDGRESDVIDAMQMLEGDLQSIHFLTSDREKGPDGSPKIVLGFRTTAPRVPIGSHGDGTRRLLALSLALTQVANELLLVDEIDTGLHWTAMEDMWRLVVETARKSSTQVFATTHSYDCIRGLDSMLRANPELGDDVCIQKMERSLDQAVAFGADRIRTAVRQGIELR